MLPRDFDKRIVNICLFNFEARLEKNGEIIARIDCPTCEITGLVGVTVQYIYKESPEHWPTDVGPPYYQQYKLIIDGESDFYIFMKKKVAKWMVN